MKTDDGYVLQMLDASLDHDGCLKVPDGADTLTYCNETLLFWTACQSKCLNPSYEKEFRAFNYGGHSGYFKMNGHADGLVLWQRPTQPKELPFIDDEPTFHVDLINHTISLNDQYAEIEAVRQTAFDTQISGGHYKSLPIQPMQFALANGLNYAQGNVIKYVVRHASKGGKEDLLKAIHNIELMIEHYYGYQ